MKFTPDTLFPFQASLLLVALFLPNAFGSSKLGFDEKMSWLPTNIRHLCVKQKSLSSKAGLIEDYLHGDDMNGPRGHWYKITPPNDGPAIIMLGSNHFLPKFYDMVLNKDERFENLLLETGIGKVYFESPVFPDSSAVLFENAVAKSLVKHNLQFGYLDSREQRLSGLSGLGDGAEAHLRSEDAKLDKLNTENRSRAKRQPFLLGLLRRGETTRRRLASTSKSSVYVRKSQEDLRLEKYRPKVYFSGNQELLCLDHASIGIEDVRSRNVHWMEAISSQVSEGEATAYIVGAFHLYGEKGLLELCAGNGWRVEHLETINSKYTWSDEGVWDLSRCPLLRARVNGYVVLNSSLDINTSDLKDVDNRIEEKLDQCPYMMKITPWSEKPAHLRIEKNELWDDEEMATMYGFQKGDYVCYRGNYYEIFGIMRQSLENGYSALLSGTDDWVPLNDLTIPREPVPSEMVYRGGFWKIFWLLCAIARTVLFVGVLAWWWYG